MKRFVRNIVIQCCMITFVISTLYSSCVIYFVNKKLERETAQALEMISAYIVSATDSEYNQLAQEIRHDLIYHSSVKEFIQYIPNTATDCPTCKDFYSYQLYFVANNTGAMYRLDTENPLTGEQFSMSSGYDEISQTRLHMTYDRSCTVRIDQKQDIVSINKMKTIFCDDCIDKILAAIDGQNITSFVIFVPQEQAFYPICEDTELQIDGGTLSVNFDKEEQKIRVEYAR